MKISLKTLSILLVFIISSCSSDDNLNTPVNSCNEGYVITEVTDTFSNTNGYTGIINGKPLEVHHYAIRILADGNICSVGYQNPVGYSGNYTIKMTNNNNGFIYEDDFSFSQSQLEFHNVSQTLSVQAGDYISVWRTIAPGYTNISQAEGKIIERTDNTPFLYPITGVNVTFEASSFEGGGTAEYDTAIPYIALGFEAN